MKNTLMVVALLTLVGCSMLVPDQRGYRGLESQMESAQTELANARASGASEAELAPLRRVVEGMQLEMEDMRVDGTTSVVQSIADYTPWGGLAAGVIALLQSTRSGRRSRQVATDLQRERSRPSRAAMEVEALNERIAAMESAMHYEPPSDPGHATSNRSTPPVA